MEGLKKQENREERYKLWIEVVPKDCESQAGLGESIPKALHKMLEFRRTQSAEENLERN